MSCDTVSFVDYSKGFWKAAKEEGVYSYPVATVFIVLYPLYFTLSKAGEEAEE